MSLFEIHTKTGKIMIVFYTSASCHTIITCHLWHSEKFSFNHFNDNVHFYNVYQSVSLDEDLSSNFIKFVYVLSAGRKVFRHN
jgi:hypothetical protein